MRTKKVKTLGIYTQLIDGSDGTGLMPRHIWVSLSRVNVTRTAQLPFYTVGVLRGQWTHIQQVFLRKD